MTSSIISSQVPRGDRLIVANLKVAGSPHPHRTVYATPGESLLWALSLLLSVRFGRRRRAQRHGNPPARFGTRVTVVGRFLREWWPHLSVLVFIAVVIIVGGLVLSVQVPR